METRSLFSGSAVGQVDAGGRVSLPGFVRRVVAGAGDERRLMFGAHESDPCLTAYEPGFAPRLEAELERRRLREEGFGGDAASHFRRARRAFGFVEEAELDGEDKVILPPLVRGRAGIRGLALFVGTGANFEIWNPRTALEAGDETLRALARFRLDQAGFAEVDEEESER